RRMKRLDKVSKLNETQCCRQPHETRDLRARSLALFTIFLLLIAVGIAGAQGAPPTANNTLLDSGFTLPYSAQVLSGSAINPATGRPFRHLWTGDTGGLCRLDPDLDTGAPLAVNLATCVGTTLGGAAFIPGRMVFDPLTNTIYSVNDGNKSNVARFHYDPT